MQLRQRNKQIPNGLFYYEPRTKWRSRPGSFDNIVQQMIAHRQANPWLNLSTEPNSVANELDRFAAQVCQQMGWTDYIIGGDPPPPTPPPRSLSERLANVAAGGEVLVEFLASKEEAVKPETAFQRAAVCAACPYNQRGDWLRFFTVPVSDAIRKKIQQRSEWKLETPDDHRLGVCEACDCPMKLKVWMPIDKIREKLSPATIARLHESCWIPKEGK